MAKYEARLKQLKEQLTIYENLGDCKELVASIKKEITKSEKKIKEGPTDDIRKLSQCLEDRQRTYLKVMGKKEEKLEEAHQQISLVDTALAKNEAQLRQKFEADLRSIKSQSEVHKKRANERLVKLKKSLEEFKRKHSEERQHIQDRISRIRAVTGAGEPQVTQKDVTPVSGTKSPDLKIAALRALMPTATDEQIQGVIALFGVATKTIGTTHLQQPHQDQTAGTQKMDDTVLGTGVNLPKPPVPASYPVSTQPLFGASPADTATPGASASTTTEQQEGNGVQVLNHGQGYQASDDSDDDADEFVIAGEAEKKGAKPVSPKVAKNAKRELVAGTINKKANQEENQKLKEKDQKDNKKKKK